MHHLGSPCNCDSSQLVIDCFLLLFVYCDSQKAICYYYIMLLDRAQRPSPCVSLRVSEAGILRLSS